jgi:hypothetical protein
MARIRWRKTYEWIRELKEWIAIVLPGILVGICRQSLVGLGNRADSLSAGIVAIPLVGLLVMNFKFKRGTKVIEECLDPDFG